MLHDDSVSESSDPVLELSHHRLGKKREVLEILCSVFLLVVVTKLCLETVAGQHYCLLVVTPQPPLHHVHLELEEVVVPGDLILQHGHIVHIEDDAEEEVVLVQLGGVLVQLLLEGSVQVHPANLGVGPPADILETKQIRLLQSQSLTHVVQTVSTRGLGAERALQHSVVQQLHRQHEHILAGNVVLLPPGLLDQFHQHAGHPLLRAESLS